MLSSADSMQWAEDVLSFIITILDLITELRVIFPTLNTMHYMTTRFQNPFVKLPLTANII